MPDLDLLADEVRVSGRTLRRAANRGTIRSHRLGERRLGLSAAEYEYVRSHWPLFACLLGVLRTLPNVRLAVLYGSVASGEESRESDLDLLVKLRRDDFSARAELRERLRAAAAREVQVVGLPQAEQSSLLLSDVLRDGRVLVDRDGDWPELKRRERAIERRAREEDRRLDEEAWAALEGLGGRVVVARRS